MANIYSYAPEAWTYNNVGRLSSNSFRFNGVGAYATSVVTGAEIGELGGELFFRGFVSPIQYNLSQGLRCRLDIYSKQDAEQQNWEVEKHFVYIKGDRNGAVNQKITTYGGTFDHIDLRLEVLADGQMSLNDTIDLTSFIIGNASSTSMGNIEEEINAALPFLVYDVNRREHTNRASDDEIYVGMIPVNMRRDNTDADAGFRTNIAVDSDGVLTERFYRDGIEELLSPIVMDLKAGRHLISDDHAYLKVTKGSHTYLATLQFEGGNMEIDTRKTLYTIETSRAGVRDITIEGRVLDMAFSGIETKLMPDEVWVMAQALDNEIIRIQHGMYNPETQTIGFQNDIEYLEEVVNGAIEFDGYWEKSGTDVGRKKFISLGKVKVLLQRADGSLKYSDYDSPDVPLLVIEESGVVDCSLILGWNFKSTTEQSNNMGMIAAYIKDDGNAYYRTITNGTMDASPFPIIFLDATLPLKEIRTFRTNDYRVGFTVTDDTNKLFTILTDRYWQGDSVESVYLKSEFSVNSSALHISDMAPSEYRPVEADNPVDGQHVNIYWNELLERTYDGDEPVQITGITITDSSPVPITVVADSVIVSETNQAMMEFISTAQRGMNTQVYLTHYGQMTEKYTNAGIDGFTAPVFVKVTASNGKTYTRSLCGKDVYNFPLPNSTTEVHNLVSRGTPDNPIPPVSAQNKNRERLLSAVFGRENVSFAYAMYDGVQAPIYDNNFLRCAFGQGSVGYVPTVMESSTAEKRENVFLSVSFLINSVGYTIQAYTTNNIPI